MAHSEHISPCSRLSDETRKIGDARKKTEKTYNSSPAQPKTEAAAATDGSSAGIMKLELSIFARNVLYTDGYE